MRHISHIILCLLLGLLFCSRELNSQIYLTSSANMPRVGDNICRRQIHYFSPGNNGEEQVWDFRDVEFTADRQFLSFSCDSDSIVLYGSSQNFLQKLKISGDTLNLIGYETSLKSMAYNPHIPLIAFPCTYGDHIIQQYEGDGHYCNKCILKTNGIIESEVDATGTIYFNDNDTLCNVTRIHQICTAGICQHLPEDSIPRTSDIKQRIEERYLWFARGYRYPVFETNSITIYNDLLPVSCQQTAFCILPSDQILTGDSINQLILFNDSIERITEESPPIFHYTVTLDGQYVNVSYSLDSDATINAILCDRTGVAYRRVTERRLASTSDVLHINISGLRGGVYILYLNVNGQIFSERIILSR